MGWESDLRAELALLPAAANAAVEEAGRETAAKTVDILKTSGDYQDRTGKYRRSFRVKEERTSHGAVNTVYSTQYQLTHLLEYGHTTANGTGRTRAFPHWQPADEEAAKDFEARLGRKLEDL